MAPKGKVKNASQKKSAAKPISGSVKKANKAPKFENGMDLGSGTGTPPTSRSSA